MFVVVTAKYLGGSLSLSRSHHATRLSPKTSHDFLGVKISYPVLLDCVVQ